VVYASKDVNLRSTLLLIKNSKDHCKKTSRFITWCNGDIRHAFKTAKIIVLTPLCAKVQLCPYKTSCRVEYMICGQLELQILKVGWFSVGWFMLAARLVRAHLDFCAFTLCYKLKSFYSNFI